MTTHDESPIIRTSKKRMAQGLVIVVITLAVGAAITVPFWNQWAQTPPPVSTIVVESPATSEGEGAEIDEGSEAQEGGGAASTPGGGETGTTPAAAGTTITILKGSSTQGNPDYEPEDAKAPLNENIIWVNEDSVPHTATSGTGPEDPNSGKIFDTSIINGGEESAPQQLKGVKEGDVIPFYCQVHPYMTSKLSVTAASAGGATAGSGAAAGNASSNNATTTTTPTTTTAGGGGNATTASSTPTSPTTAAAAAATLTIPQGASVQGNPAYEPDPITVKKGDTIAVENKDSSIHTVTNGKAATDPTMGKMFDTSLINPGGSAEIATADIQPGEYPYFCSVHPYMTGTLKVQ